MENSRIPHTFPELHFGEGSIVDMVNKFHPKFNKRAYDRARCVDTEARAPNVVSGNLFALYTQACSASNYRAKSMVLAT